jgi:hypothetical protein
MIRARVPRLSGRSPDISLLPSPRDGEHEVDITVDDLTITLYGRSDDLFAVFSQGKEMLEAFLFGSGSRDFPVRKQGDS